MATGSRWNGRRFRVPESCAGLRRHRVPPPPLRPRELHRRACHTRGCRVWSGLGRLPGGQSPSARPASAASASGSDRPRRQRRQNKRWPRGGPQRQGASDGSSRRSVPPRSGEARATNSSNSTLSAGYHVPQMGGVCRTAIATSSPGFIARAGRKSSKN